MTQTQTQRGTCPECGGSVPLYRGVLRSHQIPASALHPKMTCPGGTKRPGPIQGLDALSFEPDTDTGDTQ